MQSPGPMFVHLSSYADTWASIQTLGSISRHLWYYLRHSDAGTRCPDIGSGVSILAKVSGYLYRYLKICLSVGILAQVPRCWSK